MNDFLNSVDESCQKLGIGRTRLFELISSGALVSVKIGRSRRIPQSSIDEFISSLISADFERAR